VHYLAAKLGKGEVYLLTCMPLTGEQAERIGLVSLCVEDADLQKAALCLSWQMARQARSTGQTTP
jgi:enoyl-CoA hydratase